MQAGPPATPRLPLLACTVLSIMASSLFLNDGLLVSSHTAHSSSCMMCGSRMGLSPLPRARHLWARVGAVVSSSPQMRRDQ